MINFCIQTISYNSVINTFLAFYKVYLLLRERFSTAKIGKRKQMNKFLLLKITLFYNE